MLANEKKSCRPKHAVGGGGGGGFAAAAAVDDDDDDDNGKQEGVKEEAEVGFDDLSLPSLIIANQFLFFTHLINSHVF